MNVFGQFLFDCVSIKKAGIVLKRWKSSIATKTFLKKLIKQIVAEKMFNIAIKVQQPQHICITM